MKLARPSALSVLTIALLILLPALAVLQYRWVGQVSEAERDRMERNLRTAANQFRGAFDGEIIRAVNGLRVDATTVQEGAWDRYADRYTSWLDAAEHPGIVAGVFLVDENQTALRLRRWNATAHEFEEIGWPTELANWRPRFEQDLAAFGTRQPGGRVPFPEDDALVATPLVNAPPRPGERGERTAPVFGFTVVQWDMGYIRSVFLPALNESHFTNSDGDRYRVAVVDGQDPSRVIYQSDPSAPVNAANPDASEALFGFNPFGNRGGPGGRNDGRDDGRNDGRRNFGFRVPGSAVPSSGVPGPQVPGLGRGRDFARWALLVQHESGSLEAAVSRVRRRNLAISFGVLMLLTGSIGLLTVSSRRAHRLARQQLEFVAGVSHELRTPVAVIRSAAENLAQGVVGSGDRVKQYGQVIETEARRLGDMVERVLQYAGIASGVGLASRVPLAPADIINSAIDAAVLATGGAQVERTIAADLPRVVGDQAALRSAVENLIANALKYGGADKWVGVRAERGGTRRQPEVLVTVADHGAGIPGEELPHIFGAFYRGQNAVAGQIHGNGLGLALVRQIVSAHGGRVTVATRPGAGSAFTIHLPCTILNVEVQPRRLLLVEDEPGLVMTLTDRLTAEGYDVEAATEAQTGLEASLNGRFDVILLDVMLPGGNGLDICRAIRQKGIQTPILMLTARGQVVDRVVGLKLGADDYLVKPFEMAELLARIEALLRRSATPPQQPEAFRFGDIAVDFRRAEVTKGDAMLVLSAREFKLLKYFIEHRGAALSRDELLNEVWGYTAMPSTRTVDVHVAWLRQKVEDNPRHPQFILTVHGLGYKFAG